MELREFAEGIVFATTLEGKLWCPEAITDEQPGKPRPAPTAPGRPPELCFKSSGSAKSDFPGLHRLEREDERGRLLHFFANHELLATELMALVLLKFPDAPASFRRGVLQTLKDEQLHTRLYLKRMEACGIRFGELPVSGYFWRCVSGMEHPMDYVAGLCLTFEQANLDFCRLFATAFEKVGDKPSAELLERIYHDEIGHVAHGLKWFRRWKNPELSDWEAFCRQLKFPLSARRARGPLLNAAGRREAGFDPQFIAELSVYSKSKGRTPAVFFFNPLAEGYIAQGKAFTPGKYQTLLAEDLSNLLQFLCQQDDVVLVPNRPSVEFLSGLKQAGFPLPEFVVFKAGELPSDCDLRRRKLGELRPWAWGPDSLELLGPLLPNSLQPNRAANQWFNQGIAALYSKAWSASFLKQILVRRPKEDWICTEQEVGAPVGAMASALEAIARIRQRGHQKIIVKETHGMAGHNAIRLWEPHLLTGQRRWMEQRFQNGQELVVEPWLEREFDFSIQLEMDPRGLRLIGYTGLVNDLKGQFQGNWAELQRARRAPSELIRLLGAFPEFCKKVERLYDEVFASLEQELSRAGFLGPVGIDAFAYRSAGGACRLKPIVEINPRYTMGRLTLELMKHTAPGTFGMLRLVNRAALRTVGAPDFVSYSDLLKQAAPLALSGQPVARIVQGALCLNDPTRAQVCLATFSAGRTLREVLVPPGSNPTT